eukprot:3363131-Amphidinium_carterae.1
MSLIVVASPIKLNFPASDIISITFSTIVLVIVLAVVAFVDEKLVYNNSSELTKEVTELPIFASVASDNSEMLEVVSAVSKRTFGENMSSGFVDDAKLGLV